MRPLNDFERAKNDLDILDKQLEFNGNLLQSSSSSLQTDVLTPLEQHQLIRTNDNISKMCTKLETRIRQIRTQQELQESKKLNKKCEKAGTSKLFSSKNSEDVASFCVLKLEQLNIFEEGKEGKVKMESDNNPANFRQNLFNYMENHNLYKIPLEGNGIRQIQPI
uniref:Kinetochore protein SPC25 n=1 Tax=Meloidogyne incognita TaxID=6306 RepID=A0A914LWT4_MELIC